MSPNRSQVNVMTAADLPVGVLVPSRGRFSLIQPFITRSYAIPVGIGLGEPSMDVSMVVVSRGIHVVGYNLLAIKSIG